MAYFLIVPLALFVHEYEGYLSNFSPPWGIKGYCMLKARYFFTLVAVFFCACVQAAPTQEELYDFGVRVRSMVAAYQPDDDISNIFIPVVQGGDSEEDYIRRKGKICVFASGGLHNAWEKTVGKAYSVLHGQQIKIIRASWVRKHVDQKLDENYTSQQLHSELLFSLCLKPLVGRVSSVRAFSWWCPCDECHNLLTGGRNNQASYEISYARHYDHRYETSPQFQFGEICDYYQREEAVGQDIWQKLMRVVNKPFSTKQEKRAYWGGSYDGICLSKWLAQVFLDDMDEEEKQEEGPVSSPPLPTLNLQKFSSSLADVDVTQQKKISKLVSYLRKVNWEFSCWYKDIFPSSVQPKWKRHWRGAILPHFAWEMVGEERDESGQECEMCGYKGIKDLLYVYHPKHTPSQKMHVSKQYKKKKALVVGSECVRILTSSKEQVDEKQQEAIKKKNKEIEKKKEKEREKEKKKREREEWQEQDRMIEEAEKKLKEQERIENKRAKEQKQKEKEERARLRELKRQEKQSLDSAKRQTKKRRS